MDIARRARELATPDDATGRQNAIEMQCVEMCVAMLQLGVCHASSVEAIRAVCKYLQGGLKRELGLKHSIHARNEAEIEDFYTGTK